MDRMTLADAATINLAEVNGRDVYVLSRDENDLPRVVRDEVITPLLACATQEEWSKARIMFPKEADEERRARDKLAKMYTDLGEMSREEFVASKGMTTREENAHFDAVRATARKAHYTFARCLYDDLMARRAAAMEKATVEQISLAARVYIGTITQLTQEFIESNVFSVCRMMRQKYKDEPPEARRGITEKILVDVTDTVLQCRSHVFGKPSTLKKYIITPPANGEEQLTFRQSYPNGGVENFLSFLQAKNPGEAARVVVYLDWATKTATAVLWQAKAAKTAAQKALAHYDKTAATDSDDDDREREIVEVDDTGAVTNVWSGAAVVERMNEPPKAANKSTRGRKPLAVPVTTLKYKPYTDGNGNLIEGAYAFRQGNPVHTLMTTTKETFKKLSQYVKGKGLAVDDDSHKTVLAVNNIGQTNGLTPEGELLLGMITCGFSAKIAKGATAKFIEKARELRPSIRGYMYERGLSDIKSAKKIMHEALLSLSFTRIYYSQKERELNADGKPVYRWETDKNGKRHKKEVWKEHYYSSPIVGAIEHDDNGNPVIKNGCFHIWIDFDWAKYLANAPVMPYMAKVAQINTKNNPNSPMLAYRLMEHARINDGNGKRANIISVRSLLPVMSYLPEKDGGTHNKRRIMNKFERDFDALADLGLVKWHYCNHDKTPLTDEQVARFDFDSFENGYILFELL